MPYLIDGHNLISHMDDIHLDDPHDEAKLVLKLRGFCAMRRKKVVVVFDHGLPGGYSQLSTSTVKVLFASAIASDADSIIRQRIRRTRDIKGWIIVSSDNEILDDARRVGMRGMKSVEFMELLKSNEKPKLHKGANPNVMVSAQEVEEWLEVFGVDADETFAEYLPKDSQPKQSSVIKRKRAVTTETEDRPKSTKKSQKRDTSKIKNAGSEVDAWLDMFSNKPKPQVTDKPQKIQIRRADGELPVEEEEAPRVAEANENLKGGTLSVSDNSVDAWMELFGADDEVEREPTDPAYQRNDPKMQGRYRGHSGKREPIVHKRMATSDEIFLNEGEIDAWMDVFGASDDD